MAENKPLVKQSDDIPKVKFGSKEHAALIESGYEMSLDEAKQIKKERDENPLTHDYPTYRKALAVIRQHSTKPKAVSTDKGWTRKPFLT